MTLRYQVFVNGHLFGSTSNAGSKDALILCALPQGIPSVTVTVVR